MENVENRTKKTEQNEKWKWKTNENDEMENADENDEMENADKPEQLLKWLLTTYLSKKTQY